jgi:hypothetical protein
MTATSIARILQDGRQTAAVDDLLLHTVVERRRTERLLFALLRRRFRWSESSGLTARKMRWVGLGNRCSIP